MEQVAPRSYSVATPSGEFRRNRCNLNLLPSPSQDPSDVPDQEQANNQQPDNAGPNSQQLDSAGPEGSVSPEGQTPGEETEGTSTVNPSPPSITDPGVVCTRSGRVSVPREFYDPSWK